ncbi:MAG: hypothetical protein ACI83P_001781 [Janthinobacterium sp.]|jgi:hypothetical protein
MPATLPTPLSASPATSYEKGNQNQTTTWLECITFYEALARQFPQLLHFAQAGVSDAGHAIHVGVLSFDGVFERAHIKRAGRTVFFNNNGIHPGEPEGIDACMALVRDLCTNPARLAALGSTVLLFIPVYNVDGCLNRSDTSRVNQNGPEQFGFRGNARHLDLNRDFIKCDSLNAQLFNRLLSKWDPDVMVDTHTSNGADYPYAMTLIHTQADKLGSELGPFLRGMMLPHIFAEMAQRGWPTCPYVNPVADIPDDGIAEFLEVPRFSTGYAALHHVIGFMPETHMLKPYAERYGAMRTLLDVTLEFTAQHGARIQQLRAQAKQQSRTHWPLSWKMDDRAPSTFLFNGYAATRSPSLLGNYARLSYDRSAPWQRQIAYYDHFLVDVVVAAPQAYVVPQAWREVIERLAWNGVAMTRASQMRTVQAQYYHIVSVTSRPAPYEGHMFHDDMVLEARSALLQINPGDYVIALDQPNARYVVETLEPQAHDSFFRWGFFNSVLEKKETFSDYVFEDLALELLQTEAPLRALFERWKTDHPELLSDQNQVLGFIFEHCQRQREAEWRRYPVWRMI